MGFLDRLVSDLVQESTGLPARRLVRKIGGRNILLAGAGALLASGVAAKLSQSQAAGAPRGAASGMPPPPPPPRGNAPPPLPPGSAPPPPPPAMAEPADGTTELPQELTYAIVRTMVAAALADGRMAEEEKKLVHEHLGDSGLDDDQRRQIHQDLVLPPAPAELAALAPAAETREVLYRFAALVALSDRDVSDLERDWLQRLGDAFELSAERRQALEAQVFQKESFQEGDT